MEISHIEHIGIAVPDLAEAIKYYENALGLKCYKQEVVEDQKVTTAFFKVGDTKIELLEPTCPESTIAKFIEKNGGRGGMHHLAFAIKDGVYITPSSDSILPSVTNKSFTQLAQDLGLKVERRHIAVEELADVQEAAACGTAAVASPIGEIDDIDTGTKYVIAKDGNPGPVTTALYNKLRAIQLGEEEDVHGWNTIVE